VLYLGLRTSQIGGVNSRPIKYLLVFVFLFHLPARADVTAEAKQLFTDYLDSLHEQNYTKLISLMDDNFLEQSGGEDKWKAVLQDPTPKEVVKKVEVKKVNDLYFARFSTTGDPTVVSVWFVLVKKDGKLLLYDTDQHFDEAG
jgi:hypothetical protein